MTLGSAARAFRPQIGLPEQTGPRESRPDETGVVMTGHQCSAWHCGILAKYIRAAKDARERGGVTAWLWVDQDTDETHSVRVPVRDGPRLKVETWALKAAPKGDIAAASMPAFSPNAFRGAAALPQVGDGIERLRGALERRRGESSASRQFAAALAELIVPFAGHGVSVFATDLMRTDLGGAIIDRMLSDPRACAEAYNRAVAANPVAGMAALTLGGSAPDTELPLWLLEPGRERVRVTARLLKTASPGRLAPRALLMTGMMRLAGCDRFVHGTGGGLYDPITEAWLADWLGASLAPVDIVSADAYLPLRGEGASERVVADARWSLMNAMHNPRRLGDAAGDAEKARLLSLIAEARAAGENAIQHYRAMHAMLDAYRRAHADRLNALRERADELAAQLEEREIATDRTWPFVFFTPEQLDALTIRRAAQAD